MLLFQLREVLVRVKAALEMAQADSLHALTQEQFQKTFHVPVPHHNVGVEIDPKYRNHESHFFQLRLRKKILSDSN